MLRKLGSKEANWPLGGSKAKRNCRFFYVLVYLYVVHRSALALLILISIAILKFERHTAVYKGHVQPNVCFCLFVSFFLLFVCLFIYLFVCFLPIVSPS